MGSILISGTNRGIGLELARQYAAAGWRVYACCRAPAQASDLLSLADQHPALTVHTLDVADGSQIEALAEELAGEPIDILFNNAGVYGQDDASFGNTDPEQWLQTLLINTIAPMKMMEAFVNNVAASDLRLIATMSSKMGSMADNGSGGSYVYRSSKAAVNAVMKSAAIDLSPKGITAVILHPGWVQTEMGGPNAEITPHESAHQLRTILARVTPADAGTFFDIDGSVIPW